MWQKLRTKLTFRRNNDKGRANALDKVEGLRLPVATNRSQLVSLRQQTIRRKELEQKLIQFWLNYSRRITIMLISLAGLAALAVVVLFVHTRSSYVITSITWIGNNRIADGEIEQFTNTFKGRSLLLLGNRSIEGELKKQFPFIKNVYVEKSLPGKINLLISEREPAITFINLAGVSLVDIDGKVVIKLAQFDAEGLDYERSQIVAGFGDPNSQLVKEQYLSRLEQIPTDFDWEKIPLEQKEQILNELRQSTKTRLEVQLTEGTKIVDNSELFKAVPRVYSYDSQTYNENEQLSQNYSSYSQGITNFLERYPNSSINRMLWQSPFTILVEISGLVGSGKKYIKFSAFDPLTVQLSKLESAIKGGVLRKGSALDLRGEKLVISNTP